MTDLVGIRFREVGKITYLSKDDIELSIGDIVVVETRRGQECGRVMMIKNFADVEDIMVSDEKILRKVTDEDLKEMEYNKEKELEALEICKDKIAAHKIRMKLVDAEYMFDRSKIIFYFVSDGRVDFRNLVKDLAYIFKIRIELRQIGVRDESKILGGLGICGKPLCCATFLDKFQSVSIKMAKDQGVSLNPTKISGVCGRLLCCLGYEEETYLELMEEAPNPGDLVETKSGKGIVVGNNLISGQVRVSLGDAGESIPQIFNIGEIKIIRRADD